MKNNIFYYITAISEGHCKFSVFSCKNTYELAKTHQYTRNGARKVAAKTTLSSQKTRRKHFLRKKGRRDTESGVFFLFLQLKSNFQNTKNR